MNFIRGFYIGLDNSLIISNFYITYIGLVDKLTAYALNIIMASPDAVVLSDTDINFLIFGYDRRKDARTPEKLLHVPPVTS